MYNNRYLRHLRRQQFALFLAVGVPPLLLLPFASHAAIVEKGPSSVIRAGYDPRIPPACNLRIKGDIIDGDLQRLQAAVRRSGRGPGDQFDLCLDSRGGSFIEALKIVEYLLKSDGQGIATIIERGAECLSACALVFMAGNLKGEHGSYPLRYLHAQGGLGFHAPFIPRGAIANDNHSAQTVLNAYRAAVSATQKIIALLGRSGEVEGMYDNEPWMKSSLIQAMLAQGENEMLIIDTVDKAGRWAIEIYGIVRPGTIGPETAAIACWNAGGWIKDQFSHYSKLKAGFAAERVKQEVDGSSQIMRLSTGLSDAPDDCTVRIAGPGSSVAVEQRGIHRMMLPVVFFKPELSLKALVVRGEQEPIRKKGSAEVTVDYRIASNVSLGVLRMRNGPGVDLDIVAEIPANSTGVRVAEHSCRLPDDGRSRYQWCRATWQGFTGWVSMVGLVKN